MTRAKREHTHTLTHARSRTHPGFFFPLKAPGRACECLFVCFFSCCYCCCFLLPVPGRAGAAECAGKCAVLGCDTPPKSGRSNEARLPPASPDTTETNQSNWRDLATITSEIRWDSLQNKSVHFLLFHLDEENSKRYEGTECR